MKPRCETCGCFTKRRTVLWEGHEVVFEDCHNPKCDPYDGWDG